MARIHRNYRFIVGFNFSLIVLGVLTIVFAAIAIWLDSRAAKRN